MKFNITINKKKKSIEVVPTGSSLLKVMVDGKEYEVELEPRSAVPLSATPQMDDETAYIAESIEYSGAPQEVAKAEPAERTAPGEIQYAQIEIKSPLPGIISSIEVEEGLEVKKGDVLVYIESMKMLNDIVAPQSGRVRSVRKRANDKVDIGEVLMVLDIPGE
ncbi:MAG: biotin/lipoyl-binding protein [Candidatus Methanomethylicia archaeon]|nr:biotin/lipoyl-binding protein [Candidatus Methanomethylicia archaeon]